MNEDISIENPVGSLYQQDLQVKFYSFCSYVCLYKNRKLNIANIFLMLLEEEKLQDLFMNICDHSTKYDAVRSFLTIEPSLQKSKYLKRYINKNI
jgi:hypothetical protein